MTQIHASASVPLRRRGPGRRAGGGPVLPCRAAAPRTRTRQLQLGLGAVLAFVFAGATETSAHTESGVIAASAGATVTVRLKPTHGCGGSPSIRVCTRVPVSRATGVEVAGWTTTSADDDQGRTVVDWSGGSLPADQVGEFPVELTVPPEVGRVITLPFVQDCENGEELAWIDGDPESEYPAPRLLVLPPGSPPAATLEEVPADAPGRDQLTAVLDIEAPASTTSTAARRGTERDPSTEAGSDDDDGGGGAPVVALALALAISAAGSVVLRRTRRRTAPD